HPIEHPIPVQVKCVGFIQHDDKRDHRGKRIANGLCVYKIYHADMHSKNIEQHRHNNYDHNDPVEHRYHAVDSEKMQRLQVRTKKKNKAEKKAVHAKNEQQLEVEAQENKTDENGN